MTSATEPIVIEGQLRPVSTKKSLKENRAQGLIPGILYRKGQSTAISVPAANLPKEHTRTNVVKLVLEGKQKNVLMREVQVDTLSGKPIHFDFQEVENEDKVRVHVPLEFVGLTREQEKEGAFNIRVRYLEVQTLLTNLPTSIKVDVGGLKAGESVSLRDLKTPNMTIKTGRGQNVALASLVKL